MPRLDIERQLAEEPKRFVFAINEIQKLGYVITKKDSHKLQFQYKGLTVRLWPYSGWHSGKSIKEGRGINKLLNQINK